MNVMAQAHKATKTKMARIAANGIKPARYKVLFAIALRNAHNEYKAECKTSPVEWAQTSGHVIDPETGKEVTVLEGSSKTSVAYASLKWYQENFKQHSLQITVTLENGFTFTRKPASNYK